MRKLIRLAAVLSAIVPAAAMAQVATATDTDSEEVGIIGRVAALCVLGEPDIDPVDLDQLVNTSGPGVGRLRPISTQTVTLPDSFCNFANSQVRVEAKALTAADTTPPPTGFARAVNYTATATGWASSDAAATTNDTGNGLALPVSGAGGTQPTPKLADIKLLLSNFQVSGDKLLVFGKYDTTVTVTLSPAALAD
jgi:hypothetical protein